MNGLSLIHAWGEHTQSVSCSLDIVSLQSGLRPGCLVSAPLFLDLLEILAIDIRSDEAIQGVQLPESGGMPGNQLKISLLADDTTSLLQMKFLWKMPCNKLKAFGCVAGHT